MFKEILKIFKNDIKTIVSNPVVLIVMIVIVCLPSLYALVNISAAWDPYNGTSNMKIAIVDNDAGYTLQGVNYKFGKNLSDEIAANNTNFNWQFVDEQTARNGVKNGEYFAAFIIP
ncbi:MAG: YhgE/Pip family protein, partial [Methanobacterium sp.]|nr:YhgE/Pip family protein [Methanobacterium sp.]